MNINGMERIMEFHEVMGALYKSIDCPKPKESHKNPTVYATTDVF